MEYREMLTAIRNAQAEYIYTERQKVDEKTGKRRTFEDIGRTLKMPRQNVFSILEGYLREIKRED